MTACGHTVAPAATFSAVGTGEAFWYVNSNGLAEIAVNRGRASAVLGLAVGTPVAVAP
ncbi:MAG: SAM hydroxide adenosyltransferase [Stellaceae bacterium]